jgi:FtsH-binding integral membrane protein
MTASDAINRGYNLMLAALLTLGGIAFGSAEEREADPPDKIDDIGFVLLALIALVWYFMSKKTRRSIVPVVLAAVAVVIQIVGLVVENGDEKAFGDNIVGIAFFVPLLVFAALQYFYFNPRLAGRQA